MNIKQFGKTTFGDIMQEVDAIQKTENSYMVQSASEISTDVEHYSEFGLKSLGKIIGFPYDFVRDLNITNPQLAGEVIDDRVRHYFTLKKPEFFVREFLGQVHGCVSNKYAVFDDHQALEIVEQSPLVNKSFMAAYISPERLHIRAIDDTHPFRIEGDNSDLFFCYFIDNSMVGLSCFRIKYGIYRLACTNGMILPVSSCQIVKQIHRGNKDMAAEIAEAMASLDMQRERIIETLTLLSHREAQINKFKTENDKIAYMRGKLIISKKEAQAILELFVNTYGGQTEWDYANAISEYAHTVSLDKRLSLETKALSFYQQEENRQKPFVQRRMSSIE